MYKEINGDLIALALEGEFDVIVHGCNCFCTMGAGIAVPMAVNFGCANYELEQPYHKGDINKLGQIQWEPSYVYNGRADQFYNHSLKDKGQKEVSVVNAYTQYRYGRNHKDGDEIPVDYAAVRLCMKKINHEFKGKHVGLPQIGCGLAGGKWHIVEDIIQDELKDCDVTIVIYGETK